MASSRRTRRPDPPGPPPGTRGAGGGARISIRRATLADAPAISRVMRAAIRALARGLYTPRQLAAWSSLPPLYHAWAMTAGRERYVVAEREGRVLGYAALRGSEVTAVFVRPRAARRGLGAALLRRVEGEARRAGARRVVVRAARSAVPFYEALGFEGRRAIGVPLPGGLSLPSRLLAKPLA